MSLILTGNSSTLTVDSTSGITFPNATTQAVAAQTGPSFSAYPNNAQAVASSTWTKLQCNTEIFDTNNNFDSTTNYRFTPTVAGYYLINGSWYTSVSSNQVISGIYKNGSLYQMAACGATSQGVVIPVSSLVYLNGSTDYVELYAYQNSGGSFNTIGNRPDINYFQGFLARVA